MAKFHLTPKGQARQCSAKTPESCKYSQEAGETVAHYDSKEEAQQAYEKQATEKHGSIQSLGKKKTRKRQAQTADEKLAGEYFDNHLAKYSEGFPQEMIDTQKERYIKDALTNEKAFNEIKEWDSNRKLAAEYFDKKQRQFLVGMDEEAISLMKQRYVTDVMNNENALSQIQKENEIKETVEEYFDKTVSDSFKRYKGEEEIANIKERFVNDVLNSNEEAKNDILKAMNKEHLSHSNTPQYKENGDTAYKGVDVIENEVKFNGETYTRIDENNHMDQPYAIRVQLGTELSEEEAERVSQLFGYDYAKTGGERGNAFEQDSPNSIIVYADTTKGRAYQKMDEFMEDFKYTLENGTPIRKTDRAGAGTKGTRLVDGMGDVGYIEFYADNTFSFNK